MTPSLPDEAGEHGVCGGDSSEALAQLLRQGCVDEVGPVSRRKPILGEIILRLLLFGS